MKKLIYFIITLVLVLALAACAPQPEPVCEHEYDDNCDELCNLCEAPRVVDHEWQDADCYTPKSCAVCGKTEGKENGHSWSTPDCDTPKACIICSHEEHGPLGHDFSLQKFDAEHHWMQCSKCPAMDDETWGSHTGGHATCAVKKICDICEHEYGEYDVVHIIEEDDEDGICECGEQIYLARIDVGGKSTNYDNIINAMNAFEDSATLTLLSDVSTNRVFIIDEMSVTIDLNGFVWSSDDCIIEGSQHSSVTICDTSEAGTGEMISTVPFNYMVYSEGTLEITGGKIRNSVSEHCATVQVCYGNLFIDGGTVESENYAAIGLYHYAVGTISNGTVRGKDYAILSGANLILTGSPTIEAGVAIVAWEDGYLDYTDYDKLDGLTVMNATSSEFTISEYFNIPSDMATEIDRITVDTVGSYQVFTISHIHTGGEASCASAAICDICELPYGIKPHHTYDPNGDCVGCGVAARITVTYDVSNKMYASDRGELDVLLAFLLEKEYYTLEINLPSEVGYDIFGSIRRAIISTSNNIDLTLSGVTVIPDHDISNPNKQVFGEDNTTYQRLRNLQSVSLPDVVYIGSNAFSSCTGLKTLYAPKVETIQSRAFNNTGITSLDLPKLKTVRYAAFTTCTDLVSANLPSLTYIDEMVFAHCENLTTLVLTAEDRMIVGAGAFGDTERSRAPYIDLTLNQNKIDSVVGNVFITIDRPDEYGVEVLHTFKTITFE